MSIHIQNVILDWSGTLVDDIETTWRATNAVLKANRDPVLSLEQFQELLWDSSSAEVDRPVNAKMSRTFMTAYHKYRTLISPQPRAKGFLKFCAKRCVRVFVSGSLDARTYMHLMKQFGWDSSLVTTYLGIEDKTQKIRTILQEHQLVPNHTLFVGDMLEDIKAAQANQLLTCAVLSGYEKPAKLETADADMVCEHLGQLRLVLKCFRGVTVGPNG